MGVDQLRGAVEECAIADEPRVAEVASPLVVYEPVEVVSAAAVEREP
jgi:hypothetical protein